MGAALEKFANEKLVRDRIPEIIIAKGEKCRFRHPLTQEDKLRLLIAKLAEEREEYVTALGFENKQRELADVAEVLIALGDFYGFTREAFGTSIRRVRLKLITAQQGDFAMHLEALALKKSMDILLYIFDAWRRKLSVSDEEDAIEALSGLYEITVALAWAWGANEAFFTHLINKKRLERGAFTLFHVLEMP